MSHLNHPKGGYGEIGDLITHGLQEQIKWRDEATSHRGKFDLNIKKYRLEDEIASLHQKIDRLIDNINTLAKLICKDIK